MGELPVGMKKYSGKLEPFFETGTEGMCWMLFEDGKFSYDALVNIENGDHLKIYNSDGTIDFDGIINQDHKAGWTEFPQNPGHGQPSALGCWIHWTQKGWNPDDWAALFFNYDIKTEKKSDGYLRAELTKKKEVVNRVVFSKDLKLTNGITWYFNEEDVNHNHIDGEKRPNTIPFNVVAAKIDSKTVVFNRPVYFTVRGQWAIFQYSNNAPGQQPKSTILTMDKNLILSGYRNEDLIYTTDGAN